MAMENKDQKYWHKGEATQTPVSRGRNMTDVSVPQPYWKITAVVWSEWKYNNISIQIFLQSN